MQVVSLSPSQESGWAERGLRLKPVVLLQISLLLLIAANLGRIPALDLGDRQAPLLVGDFGAGAALLAAALTALRTRVLRLDSVAVTGLCFAVIGGLSALTAMPRFGLTAFEVVASLAYLARWVMYFSLYIVLINFVRDRDITPVWRALERALLVIAAFGIVQSIFLPNFAQMVYPADADKMDYQGHRLISTVLEPNIVAAMILTVLLVHISMLASGARIAMWKPTLLLVALVLTLSRSGVAGFVIGILVILTARGVTTRMLRLAFIGLAGLLAFLPRFIAFASEYNKLGVTDASAASRLLAWQRALEVFFENPWFGIGFNTYAFVQEHRGVERVGAQAYATEGGLLYIAVMTGVVGLAFFVWMLWLVFRMCRAGWRDARSTPAERGLHVGTVAATVAVCVHSVFVNSITVPFVMQPLVVLWGLAYVARRRVTQGGAHVGGT
jgi:O-antigen ligase